MVRTAHYKYVLYDKGRYREQLFDTRTDRGEMRNLAIEKQYADVLAQHRDILNRWMHKNKVAPSRWILNDIPGEGIREDLR